MNTLRLVLANVLCIVVFYIPLHVKATPDAGFFMPDELNEMTLHYKTYHNLILLPVTINDSVHVNLILDTGCRNLVLFGRRQLFLVGIVGFLDLVAQPDVLADEVVNVLRHLDRGCVVHGGVPSWVVEGNTTRQ